jgi:hypothetical protein
LWGENGSGAAGFELVPIFEDERFGDAKEGTDRLAGDLSVGCKDHHGAVAIPQATVVEVLQQDGEVWYVAELAMEEALTHLLLEHLAHPFYISKALPFAVESNWGHGGMGDLAHE